MNSTNTTSATTSSSTTSSSAPSTTDPFPYRKDAKIYYYGGHGNDVCDPRTRLPLVRLVPENCIYVTIAECGFSTLLEGDEEEFLKTPESEKVLRHIDLSNNKAILASKMSRRPDWVHVHMPGTPYVVSNFSPFLFWNELAENTGLALSGLIEKKDFEALGDKGKLDSSMPPSFHYYKSGNDILAEVERTGKSPYKYYKAVEMMKSFLNPGETDYLGKRYMVSDVNKILTETNYVVTKDHLLDFFAASTYPTREEAKLFLETKFPSKSIFFPSDLTEFSEYIGKVMNPENKHETDPDYPLSNTYIMKYFPGIHIYGICRVAHDCFVGLQRTLSGIQESERIGKPYKFPPTKSYRFIKDSLWRIISDQSKKPREKSIAVKQFLSEKATNIYLLTDEQKQRLYDYLLDKHFIQPNGVPQSINSNVIKYYLMPQKYRLKIGAGRKTRRISKKTRRTIKKSRKNQ